MKQVLQRKIIISINSRIFTKTIYSLIASFKNGENYYQQMRRKKIEIKRWVPRDKLRICSCLACVYRVMNARGKFGEHEKCVGVARGVAEISSSFLSALQASQVHPLYSIYAQLKAWANSFITERQQGSARRSLLLRILTTPKKK